MITNLKYIYLQVGRIFVALITGGLQLLLDPRLELIGVTLEVLETSRVFQLLALRTGFLLEVLIAIQNLFNVRRMYYHTWYKLVDKLSCGVW